MKVYEEGDIATFYFVISTVYDVPRVRGWSDNKDIVDYYVRFHNCKNYRVKKITDTIENIYRMTIDGENKDDEIKIASVYTRVRPKDEDLTAISFPAIQSELKLIKEESTSFMAGRIGYAFLYKAFPYLKPKYQRALHMLFLTDIMDREMGKRSNPVLETFQVDELRVLFNLIPDEFG